VAAIRKKQDEPNQKASNPDARGRRGKRGSACIKNWGGRGKSRKWGVECWGWVCGEGCGEKDARKKGGGLEKANSGERGRFRRRISSSLRKEGGSEKERL